MNLTLILSLLANAGTIEGSVTDAIGKFTALVQSAEAALPVLKDFVSKLEGDVSADAKALFSDVVSKFEDTVTSVKAAVSDVKGTATAVEGAVTSTATAPSSVTG